MCATRFYTTQGPKTIPNSRHRRTDCTENPRQRKWFSSGRSGASQILRNSALSRHVVTYICMYMKGTPVQHTVTWPAAARPPPPPVLSPSSIPPLPQSHCAFIPGKKTPQLRLYGRLTIDLLFAVWNYKRETIFSDATLITTFMKIHRPVYVYSWKHTWGSYKS
jgi:hypothetical protein